MLAVFILHRFHAKSVGHQVVLLHYTMRSIFEESLINWEPVANLVIHGGSERYRK